MLLKEFNVEHRPAGNDFSNRVGLLQLESLASRLQTGSSGLGRFCVLVRLSRALPAQNALQHPTL